MMVENLEPEPRPEERRHRVREEDKIGYKLSRAADRIVVRTTASCDALTRACRKAARACGCGPRVGHGYHATPPPEEEGSDAALLAQEIEPDFTQDELDEMTPAAQVRAREDQRLRRRNRALAQLRSTVVDVVVAPPPLPPYREQKVRDRPRSKPEPPARPRTELDPTLEPDPRR